MSRIPRAAPRVACLVASLALVLLALPAPAAPPTAAEAQAFVEAAEERLLALSIESERAAWVQANFITDDTEALAALASERRTAAVVELAKQATRFDGVAVPGEVARKLALLKLALTVAAPSDAKKGAELARIVAGMEGAYGKGKWCPEGPASCMDLETISRKMAGSRDPKELLALWKGWHAIAPPIKDDYVRFVELANEGARELGFADTGAMWRSKYDMPPDAFAKELDRLWEQVKPLYLSLHAYVRWKLREKYGDLVPEQGPIPAHLLGNMWAQSWTEVYPLLAPKDADPGLDLTAILKARKADPIWMTKTGEAFFTSLGFAPLPKTFWERSLFTRPRDREVVCHASAWDIDWVDDLRIKMCIEPTADDFVTIHHELGHNFYQRAYAKQPVLFRDSANDGFHEAIGDAVALSITPAYLKKLGLIEAEPPAAKDVGLLMQQALDKVAFLPFGLLVDQWRWKVFSGAVPKERYNEAWWELRRKYQGVAAPEPRSEADFDAGAKYHVPANTPYTRYFLAGILQFDLHRALTRAAGCTGPVNRCSIYGDAEAGKRLIGMLEMGQSRPWPEALAKVTGQPRMDATAVLEYFAPLKKWLDAENRGKPVGW
ncbi:MAG: peptidase M2 family protein [Acidobacteria bacterium]|nr:MAG: peptidase M2 family protein [Acidobacteriota bacterium]MCE7957764.1 peptidase M2 family protein [Acidobacteria bacterium ACB2]